MNTYPTSNAQARMTHAAWDAAEAMDYDALSVGGIVEAARERTAEKLSAVGNAAAMREALENSNGLLEELAVIGEWGESAREQIAENNAALSAPERNCDVGTAEEQIKRHKEWCDETVECLAEHNKSLDDVVFVAGNGHEIALNNFIEIARAYDYNEGYGGNEVPMDIIVVGTDWWIERHEYDGAEWWEYKTIPVRPSTVREVVCFGGWDRYVYEEGGAK